MNRPARVIALAGLARSGKDSAADVLVAIWGAQRYAFAEPLKVMLKSVFGDHFHSGDRERICPEAGVSYRRLMQTLGTGWGRDMIHPALWIRLVEKEYAKAVEMGVPFVLTDLRFASEAEWVKRMGGLIIYVDRPGVAVEEAPDGWLAAVKRRMRGETAWRCKPHQSEADEARPYADYTLVNDGTLYDLRLAAQRLALEVVNGRR